MNRRPLVSIFILLPIGLMPLLASAQDSTGADVREAKAYQLTMDKINKLTSATKSLRKLAATDPKACSVIEPSEGNQGKTLTEQAKQIEANYPKVVPLLKAEGLTVHEFLLLAAVQMQAGMAVYAKSMGMKELPAEVNPENVTFMEQHKKELDAITADLKKVPDPCDKGDQDGDAEDAQ